MFVGWKRCSGRREVTEDAVVAGVCAEPWAGDRRWDLEHRSSGFSLSRSWAQSFHHYRREVAVEVRGVREVGRRSTVDF